MTQPQSLSQRKRFGHQKPQQEEVINEVEVIEEENIQEENENEEVVTQPIATKRTRTIKQEEVVEVEEIEPEVKSVVKPASSVPRKLGYFVKPKVERVVEPVVEINEITGKDYLDKLSELFVQYAEENDIVIESQTEDGEVIATGINKDLSELLLSSFEDFFANTILPKYDKVDFFNSTFEKNVTPPNFRKSPSTKTNKDGQDSFIYTEGDIKITYLNKLDSDSLRVYFYLDEDGNVDKIENINKKKEVTVVTDNSLDYLIPSLEKYIETLGV